jgi:hypothetical protein
MNSVYLGAHGESRPSQIWDGLYKMQLIYDTCVQTVPDFVYR